MKDFYLHVGSCNVAQQDSFALPLQTRENQTPAAKAARCSRMQRLCCSDCSSLKCGWGMFLVRTVSHLPAGQFQPPPLSNKPCCFRLTLHDKTVAILIIATTNPACQAFILTSKLFVPRTSVSRKIRRYYTGHCDTTIPLVITSRQRTGSQGSVLPFGHYTCSFNSALIF